MSFCSQCMSMCVFVHGVIFIYRMYGINVCLTAGVCMCVCVCVCVTRSSCTAPCRCFMFVTLTLSGLWEI